MKRKEECQHDDRFWVNRNFNDSSYQNAIGIKTKCRDCGVIGYEVYNFSTFEVDEYQIGQ